RRNYSRDTWCTHRVSGVVSRECLRGERGAAGWYPGWSYGSRHVALSDDIRMDSPGLGYSGTRGVLGMLPGLLSRLSTRDTWLTRNAPGGFFRRGRSGHVACSEGFRMGSHGLGTRDTWRTRKASGGWLSVRLSGYVACSEGGSEGGSEGWGFRGGFRDTWRAPKVSEGGLSGWHVLEGGFGRWIRD